MYIIYKYASNSYERGRLKNDEKIIPQMYRAIRYTNTCPLFHYSTNGTLPCLTPFDIPGVTTCRVPGRSEVG